MLKVVISESQKRLIVESVSENMKSIQDESVELTKKIVSDTYKQTGINLSMLLTWGASIGGFISPVSQWLRGKSPELSDADLSLILVSVVSVIFYENKEVIKNLVKHLKDRNLLNYFKLTLKKAKDLESTFLAFIKSLNIVSFNMLSMLSYAFLVPLLPLIYDMVSQKHFTMSDVEMIARSIAGYGLITTGGNFLKHVIEKILKRFSS
jgi:hypothetical protein